MLTEPSDNNNSLALLLLEARVKHLPTLRVLLFNRVTRIGCECFRWPTELHCLTLDTLHGRKLVKGTKEQLRTLLQCRVLCWEATWNAIDNWISCTIYMLLISVFDRVDAIASLSLKLGCNLEPGTWLSVTTKGHQGSDSHGEVLHRTNSTCKTCSCGLVVRIESNSIHTAYFRGLEGSH